MRLCVTDNSAGPVAVHRLYRNNHGDGTFTDVTAEAGLGGQWNGGVALGGVAWGDYDQDGHLDLYVAALLYQSDGDGTFTEAGTQAGVTDVRAHPAWGDYDNDGRLDLYLSGGDGGPSRANLLYHNNGDGTFTDVAEQAGVTNDLYSMRSAWGDYDNDGDLDLYVGNYREGQIECPSRLYRNNGDGTFTDATATAGVDAEPNAGYSTVQNVAWGDYDGDGYADLYVLKDRRQASLLYHNLGDGTFLNVAASAGVANWSEGLGLAWGDYDNDGRLDLFVGNNDGFYSRLYRNLGDGTFADVAAASGATNNVGGAVFVAWIDYDNDGDLDLMVTNYGRGNHLYRNGANATPVVGPISAPAEPVPVGTEVVVRADFTDADLSDSHTAVWSWGDGSSSAGVVNEAGGAGSVGGSYCYTTPGVYTLSLTVTDDDGASGTASYQYLVVYDPEGGFVTGGGWITSPVGAYADDPSLTGKANFGFNSKYAKGASLPTGSTEFQFRVADLNFRSSSYEWLVVAGAKAKYKGVGAVNGTGSYGFMLSAVDGQLSGGVDRFRIKIWDEASGDTVYDNQLGATDETEPTMALAGGSIVIHRSAKLAAETLLAEYALQGNYPNPFNSDTVIRFALPDAAAVTLSVYNLQGQLVAAPIAGERFEAGRYDVAFDASELASGVYLCRLEAGGFVRVNKMTLLR